VHSLDQLCILDFETTGFDPEHQFVTEIAVARMRHGEITGRFHELVNFGGVVPPNITELTGISTEMCGRGREPRHTFALLRNFIGTDTVVAHNAAFDMAWLNRSYVRYGASLPLASPFLCTVLLAQQVLGQIPSLGADPRTGKPYGPHQLGNLCLHYGIVRDTAHRAMSDVNDTATLVQKLFYDAESNCQGWLGPSGAEAFISGQLVNRYPAPYHAGSRPSYGAWLPSYAQAFVGEEVQP
jgi:DNA polymerase III alpha subunit (gram-positive type)